MQHQSSEFQQPIRLNPNFHFFIFLSIIFDTNTFIWTSRNRIMKTRLFCNTHYRELKKSSPLEVAGGIWETDLVCPVHDCPTVITKREE